MTDRNNYIEFRVYLKDDAEPEIASELAERLQDILADFVSEDAPSIFTQDVTYDVILKEPEEEIN